MTITPARPARGRTPPGPGFTATPGLLRKLVVDRIGLMNAGAGYGDAVRMVIGPKTLYVFNHPDYAKHVLTDNADNYHKGLGLVQARRALGDGLLTSEGELWRGQRRTVSPVFQNKRISAQAPAIAREGAALVERLRARAGTGPVNVSAQMTQLTLGVLGATLLDADLTRFGSIGEAFEVVQDQAMFEMVTLGAVPSWLPIPRQRRFRRAQRELQQVVDTLVDERVARDGPRPGGDDVLSRLIVSLPDDGDDVARRRRLREDLVTLLLAGHETTASTLGWTFHLLSGRPELWDRLHDESVAVLGDRLPTYDDLHGLVYHSMVIEEAMRLYPPVWILPRQAQAADEIGGYHVPAGSDVLISPYTLHRHPEFWDSPEKFVPERFDPARAGGRARYAYIPFGAGPRYCVGNHLGMMEAVFVLSMVARELHLSAAPGFAVVPEPMLSLRVRGGLRMLVQERSR